MLTRGKKLVLLAREKYIVQQQQASIAAING